jgi:hypothetical protein
MVLEEGSRDAIEVFMHLSKVNGSARLTRLSYSVQPDLSGLLLNLRELDPAGVPWESPYEKIIIEIQFFWLNCVAFILGKEREAVKC